MRRSALVHALLVSLVVPPLGMTAPGADPQPKKRNYVQRTWDRRPGALKPKKVAAVPSARQTMKPRTAHGLKKLWKRRHHILTEIEVVGAEVALGVLITAGVAGYVYLCAKTGTPLFSDGESDGAPDFDLPSLPLKRRKPRHK